MSNQTIKNIEIIEFNYDNDNNKVIELNTDKTCIQLNLKNQNPISIINIPQEEFLEKIGECEYQFRKGIGIKGEVQRLKFASLIDKNTAYFYPYEKSIHIIIPHIYKYIYIYYLTSFNTPFF